MEIALDPELDAAHLVGAALDPDVRRRPREFEDIDGARRGGQAGDCDHSSERAPSAADMNRSHVGLPASLPLSVA
jgi:hypothetical protein